MGYEEDFVNEELVELNIPDKKGFKYKPTTAGEENDWLNEYMKQDNEGRLSQDFSKLNKLKIRNLKEVPYKKEDILKVIGLDKEWSELDDKKKWLFISKLKIKVFDQIIKGMNKVDQGDLAIKKNLD